MPVKIYELEESPSLEQDRLALGAALQEIYTILRTAAMVGKRVEIRYDSVHHQNPKARIKRTSGVPTLTIYAHDWEDKTDA